MSMTTISCYIAVQKWSMRIFENPQAILWKTDISYVRGYRANHRGVIARVR